MAWVKLTDDFPKNIKVISAGLEARALYITALCHCNENLTDGFVDSRFLVSLGILTGLSDAQASANRLVEVGLWEQCDGGYKVHDYHDYNPTRAEVIEKRQQISQERSKAGTKGADSRWQTDGKLMANDIANKCQADDPVPVPIPVPVPLNTSSAKNALDETADKPKHKKTDREIALTTLENEFSSITSIPLPPRQTDKQKQAASVGWWQPLARIWELEDKNTQKACSIMKMAITKMRHDSLTISAPRSIVNVAISIHGNGKSAEHAEQPSKVYR